MAAPNILCDTARMTNAQWLAARMHGPSGKIPYTVGGSDVAAVFGVSPWTTPLELWMIKKGRMKPPAKSNANQLEMGHLLEPIAAHWYAKKTGNRVYEDTNLYQHADHPYALANFDRRFERATDGEPGILECKSCTYHKASEWDDGAIPLYYELQLRFYLAVADVNIGSFSAIWGNNPDNDLAIPDITRDKAKEDMIFERLDEWIWSIPKSAERIVELYLQETAKYGVDNVALLSPYRQKTETGVNALNELLREKINPPAPDKAEVVHGTRRFRCGDKVMQIKNCDEISNGDIGYITKICKAGDETTVTIDFGDGRTAEYDTSQLDMLDLGYASTIHKSQGSEYRSVIINLQCAHYVMLTRPLVYTAITRGKENVIIVGERRALCMAIKKTDTEKRGTCLAKRLQAAMQ